MASCVRWRRPRPCSSCENWRERIFGRTDAANHARTEHGRAVRDGVDAGYKAVMVVADELPRIFPMMTTAAGTITPSRILIIGAGVAGLQAIATAKRLGAVVSAYDVRPAVKEQVQSLGGRFVELPLETGDAQDARGYAKAQDEAFYAKQRELLGKVIAESDAVITTAVVPGKKAPILVTEAMVKGMAPGSVILDLAAERGGNCELTRPGENTVAHGVTIIGPVNLAGGAPYHSSQVYARTLTSFLQNLVKDGKVRPPESDDIIRDTLSDAGWGSRECASERDVGAAGVGSASEKWLVASD